MKVFFVKLFCFTLLTFFLLLAIESFDNRTNSLDGNVIRIKNSLHFDSLDFLFIGPSYNYCSIKPSLFDSVNAKTYNIGVATAGVYYYDLILQNYLRSVKHKPKNVVFSFSLITFSDKASDNWDNYPIHRYLETPLSNELVSWKYGALNRYPLMLKNSMRKGVLNLWNRGNRIPAPVYDSIVRQRDSLKGYDYHAVTFFTDSLYNADKIKYEPFLEDHFSEKRKTALLALIKKTQEMGISVTLLESPTYRVSDFFNPEFKKQFNGFKQEISRTQRVISIDQMADRHLYSNIDHCNDYGAEKFTRALIKQLGI